ncbi:hypothetical protein NST84_18550 [Paenibacillus sp. FSL R7-0345]|uniref:hypothetical protein n=1 Tax=Paenibacillus sp. FSL R7-0345 TaxID=2954535 RepID=UPI00315A92E7
MELTKVYKARGPSEKSLLVAISLNLVVWSYFILSVGTNIYFAVVYLSILFIAEGIMIYRIVTDKRSFDITLNAESLAVKNQIIPADHIKTVFVRGYFKPVIGIRPKGNVLVPYENCFRFENINDIKKLTEWAEQRQIKVAHKNFSRWL